MMTLVIDVREPDEYAKKHIKGALNIPPSELMEGSPQLDGVEKDTQLVLYCVSGSRSNVAAHILSQQGFSDIINGINAQQVSAKYGLEIETS